MNRGRLTRLLLLLTAMSGFIAALYRIWRKNEPHNPPLKPLQEPDQPPAEADSLPEGVPPPKVDSSTVPYSPRRWIIFLFAAAGCIVILPNLPLEIRGWIFWGLVIFLVGLALLNGLGVSILEQSRQILARLRKARQHNRLPEHVAPETRIGHRQAALETAALTVIALLLTAPIWQAGPRWHLRGGEAEWLTGQVYFAHDVLHESGYIPLWQPYYRSGEPLIDNPFSFILNPFSAGPGLILGGREGIKLSVTIYAVIAALGGWFLGRMMGLDAAGRLFLGLLLLGKGNMHAAISAGYFQLGVSQAYMPWVIGGTLACLRGRGDRWPIVLTALSFALMFLAGNIWYTLPTLVAVLLLTLTHSFLLEKGRLNNVPGWRRIILAGILTLFLSAAVLLPVWSNRDHIGAHADEREAGAVTDPPSVIRLFFDSDVDFIFQLQVYEPERGFVRGEPHFYYSYVLPWWFGLLIFVLIPPLWPVFHRPALMRWKRIWWVALFMALATTLWGTGGSGIFVWLYENVPLLAQWRFVGRALAVASFWIAILAALRFDALLRAILLLRWAKLRTLLAGLLLLVGALAGWDVIRQWDARFSVIEAYQPLDDCFAWLRSQYPDAPLSARRPGYNHMIAFIENEIRKDFIEAEYLPLADPPTIGRISLLPNLPEYAVATTPEQNGFLLDRGFQPLVGGPLLGDEPCLYVNPARALPYLYTSTITDFAVARNFEEFRPLMQPVEEFIRYPDTIQVVVRASAQDPLLLIATELAYPGWEVLIDGRVIDKETAGGLIGVALPMDNALHEVIFRYRPPLYYQGAWLTIGAALFSILFLLRVDRWILRKTMHRVWH